MLARARELKLNGAIITKTPAVIPSFSSKGFPEVDKIIQALSGKITTGILISAYDIAKKKIKKIPNYPLYIILDSGGYECSDYRDFSDNNMGNYKNVPWKYEELIGVLDKWNSPLPTFSVSYDHPKVRFPIKEQIGRALVQFEKKILANYFL